MRAPLAEFFFACLLSIVTADTEGFRALRFARNAASQTLRPSEGAPLSVLVLPEWFLDLVERIRAGHPHIGQVPLAKALKLRSRPEPVPPLVEQ